MYSCTSHVVLPSCCVSPPFELPASPSGLRSVAPAGCGARPRAPMSAQTRIRRGKHMQVTRLTQWFADGNTACLEVDQTSTTSSVVPASRSRHLPCRRAAMWRWLGRRVGWRLGSGSTCPVLAPRTTERPARGTREHAGPTIYRAVLGTNKLPRPDNKKHVRTSHEHEPRPQSAHCVHILSRWTIRAHGS